jgi:hypothetical protein
MSMFPHSGDRRPLAAVPMSSQRERLEDDGENTAGRHDPEGY